jgi:hypothetical protein
MGAGERGPAGVTTIISGVVAALPGFCRAADVD